MTEHTPQQKKAVAQIMAATFLIVQNEVAGAIARGESFDTFSKRISILLKIAREQAGEPLGGT